jgi:hypothetical protein
MRFSRVFAKKTFAANPLIIGAAILALAAFMPRLAFAGVVVPPTLTLSPTSATNPTNVKHTVTATVTGTDLGHCVEGPGVCSGDGTISCKADSTCIAASAGTCTGVEDPDSDAGTESLPLTCTTDSECDGGTEDFCSYRGYLVGIATLAGSVNTEDTGFLTTDALGQVSLTYGTVGIGTDTLQACLDFGEGSPDDGGSVSTCLDDFANTEPVEDLASGTVTKTWVLATAGLAPLTAVNPAGSSSQHTVTATIDDVPGVCIETPPDFADFDDGGLCFTNADCVDGDDMCDHSGYRVGFKVTGRNPQESSFLAGTTAFGTTDIFGQVTFPYNDTNLSGFDNITACLDLGEPTPVDDGSVALCISDSESLEDFATNTVAKRWDPQLALKNGFLDFTTLLTTFVDAPAFNPVGTTHTVKATVVNAGKICFGGNGSQNYVQCANTTPDCTASGGTCGIAGYPVFFSVTAGVNAGAPFITVPASGLTDGTGAVTGTYTDTGGAGVDTIGSCVDADLADMSISHVPDETTFSGCVADAAEGDISSNTETKTWLTSFVTGGGKWTKPDKSWATFGGTVGQKPKSTAIVGQWDETAHASKGGNFSCHWNTFTSLKFSCTNFANCVTAPDTIQFTTALGTCGAGSAVTVTIVDGRKKPDQIKVTGATAPALNLNGGFNTLGTGNFTLHP